jgi:hypothetical protein
VKNRLQLQQLVAGLLMVFALAFSASVASANPVGEVVFTIGQATGQGAADQAPQALQKGAPVSVGQTLRTGPNGHIHIRFVDQGFVSVRPGSELLIEDFAFDAKNPKANRVKFSLKQGTGRVISGQAGQAAKENFRLNTPVSAIGIRGTDFVVQTTKDLTRVAVYQGAVVVSPFINGCTAAGTGPCSGPLAADLAGSLSNQYLEVKRAGPPELIRPKNGAAGKIFVPANPNEPAVGKPSSGANDTGSSLAGETDKAEPRSLAGGKDAEAFIWGRWAGSAGLPTGYELIGREGDLTLLRAQGDFNLPTKGKVAFRLDSYTAYGSGAGGELKPATLRNAKMTVDFNSMEYATRFAWNFESSAQRFSSKGSIQPDGRLQVDQLRSNVEIYGSLSPSGDEAAYIFINRPNSEAGNAVGVLQWKR